MAPVISTDAISSDGQCTVTPTAMPAVSVDLFCRVVDNYGDIGVCWRLARRLALGHGWRVRLWVDNLTAFARIEPAVDPVLARQALAGDIEVVHWSPVLPDLSLLPPGDVVIEAFGCDLPPALIARMQPGKQVWINLEYLSAETWVESCHGLPSLQCNGVNKYFFFPGFTPRTGGLLREPDLLAVRDAWQAESALRDALLARLGVSATPCARLRDGARLCTVFCYADARIEALCTALSQTGPAVLLVPQGVAPRLAEGVYGGIPGQVQVVRIPFVSQTDFDRLLWSADLNLVRGEDSFVRALWAGRPILWHIYPQNDGAHLTKLTAWLARYQASPAVAALMSTWNGAGSEGLAAALNDALTPSHWRAWRLHADTWSRTAAHQPDLADALVDFGTAKLRQ